MGSEGAEEGIDGVIIAGCRLGECHFKYGNYKAKDRFEALREALKEVGLEPERIRCIWHSAGEAEGIAKDFDEFVEELKKLKSK